MIASLVITFREFLEASLVIAVVLAYLKRTGQARHCKYVWCGAGAGVALSVILAFIFHAIFGGLSGDAEKVFEGATMFLASLLITWMIVWMMGRAHIAKELEARVEREIDKRGAVGIMILIAVAVLREGVETVIFLKSASLAGGLDLISALLGAFLAIAIAYIFFAGIKKANLGLFFRSTSLLLILIAAGLVSHALLEFKEAGVISPLIDPVYDITWLVNKKSFFGGILKSLFGYTGNPSLIEIMGYLGHLSITYFLYRLMYKPANT